MLNTSISPSVQDVTSTTFDWPLTTKPWVVTTVLVDADAVHARVQTMCAESGMEMACSLPEEGVMLLSIHCYVIEHGRWTARSVTHVSVGMLGEEAVAVFRDDQGNDFCPDAPNVPASSVMKRVRTGQVVECPLSARPAITPTVGRRLHNALLSASEKVHGDDDAGEDTKGRTAGSADLPAAS